MRLLIFPGGGDPSTPLYNNVYSLLEDEALNYGYKSVDSSIRWPGQFSFHDRSRPFLTLHEAQKVAEAQLLKYESQSIQYDVLGRSFGALVAVKCAADLNPKYLRKLILWSPPVYWSLWHKFVRNLEHNQHIAKEKGLRVDKTYFASLVPFECFIRQVKYPAVIATGTNDIYVSPAYIQYLRSIVEPASSISFKIVPNASHEVTKNSDPKIVQSYLDALFD